ncbi:hypothetical protein EBU99_01215 [bacterium]|nr:hypothetical protein [bacterium]
MKIHWKRIDASLLCFALVVLAAIPVAALRTKTYGIGYELGRLKTEERQLRQKNIDLQSQLAAVQRTVRESRLKTSTNSGVSQLNLPSKTNVLRPSNSLKASENSKAERNP